MEHDVKIKIHETAHLHSIAGRIDSKCRNSWRTLRENGAEVGSLPTPL